MKKRKRIKKLDINELCQDETLKESVAVRTHVERVQKLMEWLRESLTVASWYRTEEQNKEMNGSEHSQHLKGIACDLLLPDFFFELTPFRKSEYINSICERWHNQCNGGGCFCILDDRMHLDSRRVKKDLDYRIHKDYNLNFIR